MQSWFSNNVGARGLRVCKWEEEEERVKEKSKNKVMKKELFFQRTLEALQQKCNTATIDILGRADIYKFLRAICEAHRCYIYALALNCFLSGRIELKHSRRRFIGPHRAKSI